MRLRDCRRIAVAAVASVASVSIGFVAENAAAQAGSAAGGAPQANTLTAAQKGAGWRLLFDGTTTKGWRGYKLATMPPGWTVVSGELTKADKTVDIVTGKPQHIVFGFPNGSDG